MLKPAYPGVIRETRARVLTLEWRSTLEPFLKDETDPQKLVCFTPFTIWRSLDAVVAVVGGCFVKRPSSGWPHSSTWKAAQ